MKRVRNITVVLSIIIVSFSFLLASCKTTNVTSATDGAVEFDLPAKTNSENSVSIEVTTPPD
ncbi:hypothetical protein HKBW3S03_01476 [Candidatus Hakubella thermalkaliphila]|uniref:Uncharacterized protein n=1 Tax=Candidatus Hakubella thermalkaliphila TaxID=2754717 RepID=A0A6V8NTY6_9ACTN|nr:hypothetical protein HKBW3S03_01476 [Candidatus Hakubella thermalkaliphila]GFP23748.1 hypothetical protein HKBW3S09_01213 [Candidatus Hakubella thermalkaliphila]GFP30688.1 hypothetical protein HKBW3S34_01608 [Candidatus Hakubella thermalkaliphila]GFP39313.1 hypothetical protein HKBW3S47_01012 [Candidatus Hakubella thermalkaliphila]